MITLYDYQQTMVNRTRTAFRTGFKAPLVVSPCGSGKSVIISEIVRMTTKNKKQVLFLVHRKELIEQIEQTFIKNDVDLTYAKLGMVQTVVRRLDKTEPPSLIVIDESHHALANSYKKIIDYFNKSLVLGFTATPVRLNGGGMGDINDIIIEEVNAKFLIGNGFLAPYRYYAPAMIDTDNINIRRGEFVNKDIEDEFNNKKIWGDVVKHYRKLADGEQAICYCSSIFQSQTMAETFNNEGIAAQHIDAKTPKQERTDLINQFRNGDIKILCNVDLIGEGFDVPDCSTVIMLRPTQSLSLYIQQSMRGMRFKPDKVSVIIDHVGNVERFGLPDMEREWSLEPKKGSNKKTDGTEVKICKECFATVLSTDKVCGFCGAEFKVEIEAIEIEEDAELREISSFDPFVMDTREPEDCESMKELYDLAKHRGYKRGWAYHQGRLLGMV